MPLNAVPSFQTWVVSQKKTKNHAIAIHNQSPKIQTGHAMELDQSKHNGIGPHKEPCKIGLGSHAYQNQNNSQTQC